MFEPEFAIIHRINNSLLKIESTRGFVEGTQVLFYQGQRIICSTGVVEKKLWKNGWETC